MFDFLKKPTHHLQSPQKLEQKAQETQTTPNFNQSFSLSLIPQILEKQAPIQNIKKPARVKKYQQNAQVKLNKQVQKQLKDLLQQAEKSIRNVNANEIISQQMKLIQKRVFIRYTSSNQHEYLQGLYDKTTIQDRNLKRGLSDLIFGTLDTIAEDIQSNKYNYEVAKQKILTRDEIIQAEQLKQIHLIKKKQDEISSKVGQLRMELNIVQNPHIVSKAKSIVEKDSYSKDNQKTKEAQKYLELKRIQRQEIQRKKKQQIQRKKQKQLQQKVLRQKQLEKAKSQRHSKLIQKLEEREIQKQKRKQQIESQREKFSRFLKEYRKEKPLYQIKMEQQIKREVQQKKLRFYKMAERKGVYDSISFLEIQDFQQKYLKLKKEQKEKKKIQTQIKKDQQKLRLQQFRDKHYKGKFRYLVLEQMVNREAKNRQEEFSKRLLLQRKRAYSVDIKQKYKPSIDETKKIEIQTILAQSQKKNRQKGTNRVHLNSYEQNGHNTISYEVQEQVEPNPKKEGKKNMQLFKQYIHEKIQRGQVKRPETLQSQVSTFIPKIDYLKQQRENREKKSQIAYQSLDASSRIKKIKKQSNGDIGLFKLKAEQLDEKARRQQLKLKYSEHTPLEEKELQQNYLASIQAKIQLLKDVN